MSLSAHTTWAFLCDIALRGTLFLLLGAIGARCLYRSSAASRYLVRALTLSGLLALPLLRTTLPAYDFAIPRPASAAPAHLSPTAPMVGKSPFVSVSIAPAPPSAMSAASPEAPPPPFTADRPAHRIVRSSRMTWLPALWLFGTVVSLGYFLTGLFRLRRLRRECVPVSDERTLRLGREIGQRLGVARGVTMLRAEPGSGIRAPMTWGFLRPVVLLPDFLSEWPDESLRAALLHEFAHIRRADWLTQIVTFAACSLYWFHPGVWRMAAILRQDGEQSCDDIVLLAGVAPTTYAGSLLEVISMQKESRSAPTLAQSMGQPPIEMRVRAILAQSHPRLVSRATGVCTILLGALLLVPLSAARVNAGSPAVQPDATIAMLSRPEQTVQTVAQSSPDPARQTKAASVTALQKRLNRAEAENKKLRRMLDSARQQNRAVSELEINRLRAQMQQLEQQLQAATRVAVPLPNRRAPQPFSTEGRFQLIKRAEALQQQKALLDIQVEQAMAAYRSGVTTQSSAVALKAQRDLLALKIAKARLDLNDYNAGKRLSKRERDRRDLEYQLAGLRIQKDAKLQAAATLEARVKVGAESPATLISLKAELAGLDARIAEFEKRLADVKTSE